MGNRQPSLGSHFRGRKRLIAGACAGLSAFALTSFLGVAGPLRLALSWDLGIFLYLVLSCVMMVRSRTEHIEQRARELDVSLGEIVALAVLAAAFSLIAAARVIGVANQLPGGPAYVHLAAGFATIVLSWGFVHTLFAIHYAHAYHGQGSRQHGAAQGGLRFPGDTIPDYWDFVYFAAVIAMTCQVSDVSAESRDMRHLVTAH